MIGKKEEKSFHQQIPVILKIEDRAFTGFSQQPFIKDVQLPPPSTFFADGLYFYYDLCDYC